MTLRGETAYALATQESLNWIPNSVSDELDAEIEKYAMRGYCKLTTSFVCREAVAVAIKGYLRCNNYKVEMRHTDSSEVECGIWWFDISWEQ